MNNSIETIECEKAIELLLQYLDNELDYHDHTVMENHLHTCRSCFSRMEFEQKLKGMLKVGHVEQAPDELKARIHKITKAF